MVPEGKHVRAVYLDSQTGVLAAKDLGDKILIDCSTIDTATSLEVGDQAKTRHSRASFYDAPVSGGTVGAKKGTITFMIGAVETDSNLPLMKSVLSLMGHNIFTCGGPSLGLTAKFCNNYLSSSITLLNAEMFNFAIKSGMDPRILQDILKVSSGCNRNQEKANPVPGLSPEAAASKGYKLGFRIEYVKKDIGLTIDACERVGAKLCLGKQTWNTYADAVEDARCTGLDSKVVYRFIGGEEKWQNKFE
jgi:3-hydroxyisobutyrate dehydrogenase